MAKEYIEREAVCYQLEKQETIDGQPRAIRRARRIVEDYPAADVAPVVHAHWINDGIIHCSRCNAYLEKDEMKNHTMKYCYYCGARMEDS